MHCAVCSRWKHCLIASQSAMVLWSWTLLVSSACFYSAPIRGAEFLISASAYFRNNVSKLHQIFCACQLWLWLDPPLAVHYVLPVFQIWMSCLHIMTWNRRCKKACAESDLSGTLPVLDSGWSLITVIALSLSLSWSCDCLYFCNVVFIVHTACRWPLQSKKCFSHSSL